jgi:hypothetical protein
MATRYFRVDYGKLSWRQCINMAGGVGGPLIYLKRYWKKGWLSAVPLELGSDRSENIVLESELPQTTRDGLAPVVDALVRLGYENPEYRSSDKDIGSENATVIMLHQNREQVALAIFAKPKRPGHWHAVSIFSRHSKDWLNVADSAELFVFHDPETSELLVMPHEPPDALHRFHTSLMEKRRPTDPPKIWKDYREVMEESENWAEEERERFVRRGLYVEITEEEAAKLKEKYREALASARRS